MSARLSASAMVRLVNAAADLMADWPQRFYMLLEEIRTDNAQYTERTGLEHDFGAFYETLSKSLASSPFDFIREEMQFYIQHQWDGGFISQKNIRLNLVGKEHERFLTRAAAARFLSVRPRTISRHLDANRLRGKTLQMGSRTLTLIEKDSLHRYAAIEADVITFQDARKMLGLSERGFRSMLKCGVLHPLMPKEPTPQHKWSFSRARVKQLLVQLLFDVPEIARPDCGNYFSFVSTMRRLTPLGYGVGTVVDLALKSELPVASRDVHQTGLRQCNFTRSAVEYVIACNSLVSSEFCTLPDAATLLGLKQQVIYHLANHKYLPVCTKRSRGRAIRAICRADLEAFGQAYVSAKSAAEQWRTSPRAAIQQMAEKGVHPIIGPKVDGCRQYFFARADVSTLTKHLDTPNIGPKRGYARPS